MQRFCRLGRLDAVRIPGKRQLQLYHEMVSESELREVVNTLLDTAADKDSRLVRDGPRWMKTVVRDRGFHSKMSRELLAGRGIVNAIAPRDAGLLRARLREGPFQQLHQRRGQTEARIAIFKNAFPGAPLLAKGYQKQGRLVA